MQPDEEIERECNSLRIPNGTYYKYIWILVLGKVGCFFRSEFLKKFQHAKIKAPSTFQYFLSKN